MNSTLKMAFAAAAALAVVACGRAAVAPASVAPSLAVAPPSTAPSPTLSPTAAPTPTPNLLDTSTWKSYVSKRYGFSIARPADWNVDPADHDWSLAKDAAIPVNTGAEHFANGDVGVSVWSVAVDPGTTVESWLPAYCKTNIVDCTGFQNQAVTATMDGHAGLLAPLDAPHALFLVDGRIYAIACWRADDDPGMSMYGGSQRLVEAFLSTMHLQPGGPAPSTSPGPS